MNAEGLLAHYARIADVPDAITRLRRFVLDLAARGKLVTQEQKEEPAAVLLSEIATVKRQWEKVGKIRDRPALPPVNEAEIPFLIPSTWEWVRFAHIADFSAGRTPSRNDMSFWDHADHAWVSIRDMEDGQVLIATKESVSNKARVWVFGSEPEPPGTMLMSFKLTIGKISRLGISAFHNEAIISVRPHLADLDPYLFKVLPQFAREGNCKDAIKGATLNRSSISNILLPLPPLAEQHRIVAKVDELMALCDQLEAARAQREATRDRLAAASLAHLNTPNPRTFPADARFALDALPALTTRPDQIKQLRQTILNLAVRGKLVPQDSADEPAGNILQRLLVAKRIQQEAPKKSRNRSHPEPEHEEGAFNLPTGWTWASTLEVCSHVDSGSTPPAAEMKEGAGDIPFIKVYNLTKTGELDFSVKPTYVSEETHRTRLARSKIMPNDVLMNIVGPPLGKVSIVPDTFPEWNTNQAVVLFRPLPELLPKYLATCLMSTSVLSWIIDLAQQTVGQVNISVSKSRRLPIPFPPPAEQRRIVAKVDKLMVLCDQLEASLTAGESTRRRLLDALLHEALAPVATPTSEHPRAAIPDRQSYQSLSTACQGGPHRWHK